LLFPPREKDQLAYLPQGVPGYIVIANLLPGQGRTFRVQPASRDAIISSHLDDALPRDLQRLGDRCNVKLKSPPGTRIFDPARQSMGML
jgi:hypothetical protein